MLKISEIRQTRDKTQKEVAITLGLGRTTYNQYETGKREPDLKTLVRIANYFQVTTDYLLGNAPPTISELPMVHIRLIELYKLASPKIQKAIMDILEDVANPATTNVKLKSNVEKEYEADT